MYKIRLYFYPDDMMLEGGDLDRIRLIDGTEKHLKDIQPMERVLNLGLVRHAFRSKEPFDAIYWKRIEFWQNWTFFCAAVAMCSIVYIVLRAFS